MVHLSEENWQARARYLRNILEESIDEPQGHRYLAVGTGDGANIDTLSSGYDEIHTVDIVSRDPTIADQFVLADGTYLPYDDDTFDLITAISVIEHVLPPQRREHLVREMARCTVPGGNIMFQIPNHRFILELHTGLPFVQWMPWEEKIASMLGTERLYDINIPRPDTLRRWLTEADVEILDSRSVTYPRDAIPKHQQIYSMFEQIGVFDIMPFGYVFVGEVK